MYRKHVIRSFAIALDPGAVLPGTGTDWSQLVLIEGGHAEVRSERAVWLMLPERALWLPPARPYELRARTRLELHCVYFPEEDSPDLPDEPVVLHTDRLTRALILEAVANNLPPLDDPEFQLLLELLVRRLPGIDRDELALPLPVEARARAMALAILDDVGGSLEAQAARVGASLRTMQRLFSVETGAPLGAWRRAARLHIARRLLASGAPIHEVAARVGYSSASAFIHSFRARTGETPARWASRVR